MKPTYLYVTPFFPSEGNWRGAYCYDFVKALEKTGKYDVKVLMPGEGGDYVYGGIKVHRFVIKALPSNLFPFLFRSWNELSFLEAVKRSGVDFKDVAVCHGNTANLGIYPLAVKRENPNCLTLLHHHDLQSFGLNNGALCHCWLYNVFQFMKLRKIHEQIDCHVCISGKVEESLRRVPDVGWTDYDYYRKQMRGLGFFRPLKLKKAVVLHNGVDTSVFKPLDVPRETKSFTIGCIGNFQVLKGQVDLLKALALIKDRLGDWRLKFVGSGALEPEMRKLIAENGMSDNVEFLSEVRHEELPDFYRSLDLFVLPSWFEGFGCVFTEAWSCGVPFISCIGQGTDDLIKDGDRGKWLCRPHDSEDLASKIFRYWKTRDRQELACPVDVDVLVAGFANSFEQEICK